MHEIIKLKDTCMIVAPTLRSRAYLQTMHNNNIYLNKYILLPGNEPSIKDNREIKIKSYNNKILKFKPNEKIIETLSNCIGDIVKINTDDLQSTQIINLLKDLKEKYIIYSGFGGVILKNETLNCSKKFLHIHGGYAPNYKGSTAFYYSLIEEKTIGATALWLNARIDEGPIILRHKYTNFNKYYEIDTILDPLYRADVLLSVLEKRIKEGKFNKGKIMNSARPPYHVIHPILKHVALKNHFPSLIEKNKG